MSTTEGSPIHEKVEEDLPIIFEGSELQPMHTTSGVVWRRARAAVGNDPNDGYQWLGMQEKSATLSHSSRYERHDRVIVRRLSPPGVAAILDMDRQLIHAWQGDSPDIDIGTFLRDLNQGLAILKLFGEPLDLAPDDYYWSIGEDH